MRYLSTGRRDRASARLTCRLPMFTAALCVFFLSAGCTSAGTGMASEEPFAPALRASGDASVPLASPGAELIYAQIVLSQSMVRNDHRGVLEMARIIAGSREFSSAQATAVIDASAWLVANGHAAEAEELLEVASQRLHDDFNLLAMRADLRMQSGKNQEALALLREFTSRHPENMKAKSALATVMIRCGQVKEALKIQDSIPESDFTPEMRFAYAQALHIEGDMANAEKQLRIALQAKPDYAEAMTLLALTLERSKRYAEAEDLYEKILELDEDNSSSRLLLLRLYLLEGKIDSAVQAVLSSGEPVKFAASAASIAMEEKNFSAPVRFLEQLEKRREFAPELYFYHASLLYEHRNDAESALKLLDKIRYGDESFVSATKLKIQILLDKHSAGEAYALLDRLIEAHPGDIAPLILAGDTYARQKDHAAAERFYARALEIEPDQNYAMYQLAYQKELQGLHDEACAMMENIIRQHPDNALALNYIAYYLAEHGTELDKALDYAARAADLEPQADFILDSLAWVHYQRKEYEQAWKVMQRAHMLHFLSSEHDPVLLEHYGDIAAAAGEWAPARKGWQEALELFRRQGQADDEARVRGKLEKME